MPVAALQRHRVNRVSNFAYENVTRPIDLDSLADVACWSKFHFSRVFADHLRESPLRFLWRLRLERAARSLVHLPEDSVTDVALNSGFSSSQTFSKTFRQRFNMSPRAFRSGALEEPDLPRAMSEFKTALCWPEVYTPLLTRAHVPVRIEERPDYRVAYIRQIGPYFGAYCGIQDTFGRLEAWARARGIWDAETAAVGVCPDHSAITPPERCRYDAGIIVSEEMREDEVVSIQTVRAGLYAVFPIACEDVKLDNVWEWFTSVWLPASGYTREFLPSYEFYPAARGRPVTARNGVELCVRLRTDLAPQTD
ncbi:MAG: GyrI-like domain-containing protein [Pseudomonadota bacterium]